MFAGLILNFTMSKAKALVIIMSGSNNPAKVKVGLNMAWGTKNSGAFEDVKLILVGQAEDFIANYEIYKEKN